jgi:uncharacterized protein (DUF1919 family)
MISIIITVKNDRGINDTLLYIEKLSTKYTYEVIVVDASEGKLDDIRNKYKNVNWIEFKNSKLKKVTIPEQRNIGIQNAKGDIIVFIDASCIPSSNWLDELVKPIVEESEYIVMGKTGTTDKISLNDLYYQKIRSKYVDEAPTINLAISMSVIKRTGYFDESFEYGSDGDFTLRAGENGYLIYYQSSAFLTHNWGGINQEITRNINYGKGRLRVILKHFRYRYLFLFGKDSPMLVYPLLILSIAISFFFPWYLVIFLSLALLLILKNIRDPDPHKIVLKHFVYGLGVLIGVVNEISFSLINFTNKIIFHIHYLYTSLIVRNKGVKGKVKNLDFTIVSNNCWGAEIYKELGIAYNTPFVGLYLFPEDYIQLLKNLHKYLNTKLIFTDKSKYLVANIDRQTSKYPIGLLNDVEIHFKHYKSQNEARNKWERRIKRVNYDSLFVEFSDRDGIDQLLYKKLLSLPYKNVVCFVSSTKYNSKKTVLIKDCINDERVMDGKILYTYSKKYFDIAKWLNRV